MDDIPFCLGPDANPRPPAMPMPAGACDSHAHVFDAARYPYQATRGYTPPDNGIDKLLALHDVLGISRGVITQASVHGTDNRAVLDAADAYPERLRAIVAVSEGVTEAEILAMHAQGARGIRVNLVDRGGMPFKSMASVAAVADILRPMGWHIELLVHVEQKIAELRELAEATRLPISVGHIGYTKPSAGGMAHPGYSEFLAMLRDGQFWVKLTGLYRISAEKEFPYSDSHAMARAVIAAAPDRILWGTDWPHVSHYGAMPNDGDMLGLLAEWARDAAVREKILRDNPAVLYGFSAA